MCSRLQAGGGDHAPDPRANDAFERKSINKGTVASLRYHISGPNRDALVEQTLAALAHDSDAVLEFPIEKAVALTMHHIFLSNMAQNARLNARSTSPVSNAQPVTRL